MENYQLSEELKDCVQVAQLQLGWKLPDHIVAPLASGSLFTKIYKGFQEFIKVGLVADKAVRFSGNFRPRFSR